MQQYYAFSIANHSIEVNGSFQFIFEVLFSLLQVFNPFPWKSILVFHQNNTRDITYSRGKVINSEVGSGLMNEQTFLGKGGR